MVSQDGNTVLVFNGEIYNYLELRKELEPHFPFFSQTDSEVLLNGYRAWGWEELLRRIDGMFAFAIWDKRARRVHLARDRAGKKPLFYAHVGGRLLFASTLNSILELHRSKPEIDPGGHRRVSGLPGCTRAADRIPGRQAIASGAPAHLRCRYSEAQRQTLLGRRLYTETEAIGRRAARRVGRTAAARSTPALDERCEAGRVFIGRRGFEPSGSSDGAGIAPAGGSPSSSVLPIPVFDERRHARAAARHLNVQPARARAAGGRPR